MATSAFAIIVTIEDVSIYLRLNVELLVGVVGVYGAQQQVCNNLRQAAYTIESARQTVVDAQVVDFMGVDHKGGLRVVHDVQTFPATFLDGDILQRTVHRRDTVDAGQIRPTLIILPGFVFRPVALVVTVFLREDGKEEIPLDVVVGRGRLVGPSLFLVSLQSVALGIRLVSHQEEHGIAIETWHAELKTTAVVGLHLRLAHFAFQYQFGLHGHFLFQACMLSQVGVVIGESQIIFIRVIFIRVIIF